jgi:hypothetical protein
VGPHVDEALGGPDEPDAVVGLDALAHHIHHGNGTAEVLHVAAAVGGRLPAGLVLLPYHEGVEGLVAEARAAVRVEPYQQGGARRHDYGWPETRATAHVQSLSVPVVKLRRVRAVNFWARTSNEW